MALSWFDASEAKAFGVSLAHFYMERIPSDTSGGTAKALDKKPEVVSKMLQQLLKFKLEHELNIYKKAQLGNAFKWALKDAGYDPGFVDQLTKDLMLKL